MPAVEKVHTCFSEPRDDRPLPLISDNSNDIDDSTHSAESDDEENNHPNLETTFSIPVNAYDSITGTSSNNSNDEENYQNEEAMDSALN